MTEAPAILWFRQDLRLSDHAALHAALFDNPAAEPLFDNQMGRHGRAILPVFVLDDAGAYVRRFVPELAGLDDKHLHAPWQAPAR